MRRPGARGEFFGAENSCCAAVLRSFRGAATDRRMQEIKNIPFSYCAPARLDVPENRPTARYSHAGNCVRCVSASGTLLLECIRDQTAMIVAVS